MSKSMSKPSWLLLKGVAYAFLFAVAMGLAAAGTYFAGAVVKNVTAIFQ